MILSDREIRSSLKDKFITIDPFDEKAIQPASVDLTLSNSFIRFPKEAGHLKFIHLNDPETFLKGIPWTLDSPIMMGPKEFMLGSTREHIGLSDEFVARVEGKSSIGRLGLLIHATAGFIDPGFKGKITLELYNLHDYQGIALYPGKYICQISFEELRMPAEKPYGHEDLNSHYQDQIDATTSRYGIDR